MLRSTHGDARHSCDEVYVYVHSRVRYSQSPFSRCTLKPTPEAEVIEVAVQVDVLVQVDVVTQVEFGLGPTI